MLVLGRKQGESIRIDEGIEITVVGIQGNRVRLGIHAPDHVRVLRSELEDHSVTGKVPPDARPTPPPRCAERNVA